MDLRTLTKIIFTISINQILISSYCVQVVKTGKSDFLISRLVHMAAGILFLGITPSRPMKISYELKLSMTT